MSRMTKFLKQRCVLEKPLMEGGQFKRDDFGAVQYGPPVELRCRKELTTKDIQTANGSISRATAVYYLDEQQPVEPEYRLDGRVVLSVSSYANGLGNIEGYEVYV